jgi:hypothetical protein
MISHLTCIAPEAKHSSNPLKRFGTVLSRRRHSVHPYGRAGSPERKSSSNLGSTFGGFGKGKPKERDTTGSPSPRPASPLRRISSTPRASDVSGSPKQTRQSSSDRPNGTVPESATDAAPTSSGVNGTAQDSIPELKEPMPPPPSSEPQPEVTMLNLHYKDEADSCVKPQKDAEGFTVPPSASDAITEAEREAGL